MNCTENVVGIDVLAVYLLGVKQKKQLTQLFKLVLFLCCQIISEHFDENRVTL